MVISSLYIDRSVKTSPRVDYIRNRLNLPARIVDDAAAIFNHIAKHDDPVEKGKQTLYLTRNKGLFVKKCPGTSFYTCCGYKILHIGTFCTMDCSYCILQAYFHPPILQYFVNHDDLMEELESHFSENAISRTISRIGTGEFTDSLIWEPFSDLTKTLVLKFSQQTKAVLELKTKTINVKKLEKLHHNRKTILAWSLNTDRVVKSEERKTSSLKKRLEAAAMCESWGYPLAFHFDPLVIYDRCENDYRAIIRQIFTHVSAENIVWISLGTFRFMPELKQIIRKRFPESKIIYGEFIQGLDRKMRYFKPLRIALYKKIISFIRELAPDVLIYFCMEDDEVWKKTIGFLPSDKGGLSAMLDESAVRHCGLEQP
ncbi:MAG: DNA photolyase [Deltaproteobacteria bacterium]|nr:DNA photolyase [Deltaproteobacteria bacterium]MBW2219943.1 DNA photolyase [Deltaproteobacteria bacterium]